MAKIVLSKDAPEGQDLKAQFGALVLDAKGGDSYETDDPALIEEAQRHPFFDVEESDDESATAARDRDAALDRLAKAQADWDAHRAVKDPLEDMPPYPTSVEDLDEEPKKVRRKAKEADGTAESGTGVKAGSPATDGGKD